MHIAKIYMCISLHLALCIYNLYNTHMNKQEMIQELLEQKRTELVWALSLQDYTHEDIAYILRSADRSTITRMINKRPEDWQPKWIKRA